MFGSCCFKKGDVKVTLGTGTFVNINTGRKPHVSVASRLLHLMVIISTCQDLDLTVFCNAYELC